MNAVLCVVSIAITLHGKPNTWSGQLIGLEINSKERRSFVYVDFTSALKRLKYTIAEDQTTVFYVNDNNCLYLGSPVELVHD